MFLIDPHVAAFVGLCLIAATITGIANRQMLTMLLLKHTGGSSKCASRTDLQYDTMHGVPSLPLLLPVYRLHSLEVLWALVSG